MELLEESQLNIHSIPKFGPTVWKLICGRSIHIMQSQQQRNTQIKSESWILFNIMYLTIYWKCFMFELLVIETSPICQSFLSQTETCLAKEGNVQLTSPLKGWVSDLSVEKFFLQSSLNLLLQGRPLSWRNPFLSFRKWFVRAQFSAFFKARFCWGGWDQPDCF